MMQAKEFLDAIFSELEDGEHICVSRATPKKDGSGNFFKTIKRWGKTATEHLHGV
jgi:hypothetical protein